VKVSFAVFVVELPSGQTIFAGAVLAIRWSQNFAPAAAEEGQSHRAIARENVAIRSIRFLLVL